MASRLLASQASRSLRRALTALPSHAPPNMPSKLIHSSFLLRGSDGYFSPQLFRSVTTVANLPAISDPDILQALRKLMAVNWLEIADEAKDAVEAAVSKKTDDIAGLEQLKNAWRAAEAVEKFSGTLVSLRMTLDDYSGVSGDKIRPLSPAISEALKSVLSKYNTYLASFKDDEFYLKKKVEVELGSLLVHIRQRCSGLGPEWGNISLLGTSGISGSFIEHRAN